MNLSDEPLVDALRLIRTPGVGPVTFFHLLHRFGSASEALAQMPELSRRGGRKTPLAPPSREAAEQEIEATEAFGARMIVYGAPDYPKLLLSIPDAPPIITLAGHTHLWKDKCTMAMVGARNASANGCQLAQHLAQGLGRNDMVVVSGLARGIDTFAHKGALKTGTVAVIAGGIDNIYPPENAMLYAQIRETGAIISEQPFGSLPFAAAFPGRNRIIAGMSLGTLVVEASPKSGSLITARLAGEYGREVFAVPGSPLDPRSKGCNQLIKEGAVMVETAADVIQGIAQPQPFSLQETPPPPFVATAPGESELADARQQILEKLGTTAVSIDELIAQCHISAAAAMSVVLELELAGRLARSAGNRVALAANLDEEVA